MVIRLSMNREEILDKCARTFQKIRLRALKAYSGGNPRCMCECGCTESKVIYLDIDHVNNDATEHFEKLGIVSRRNARGAKTYGSGGSFLHALRRLGWPNDPPLRVLCLKCNAGRQRNGGQCPELGILSHGERRKRWREAKKAKTPPSAQPPADAQPTLFDGMEL